MPYGPSGIEMPTKHISAWLKSTEERLNRPYDQEFRGVEENRRSPSEEDFLALVTVRVNQNSSELF